MASLWNGRLRPSLRAAAEHELPSLLIGANAVLLLGYVRNTIDLDLLVPEQSRSGWLDLMGELGYRLFHGTTSFAQFESRDKTGPPVDLMFVDNVNLGKASRRRERNTAGK